MRTVRWPAETCTSPEEIQPDLARFLGEAGAAGDRTAWSRDALESPRGPGAQIARVHCEVATMLAGRLGLGSSVRDALDGAFKRRDGRGLPNRRAGDEVPLPVRIATLARDIEVLTRAAAIDQIRQTVERRRGRAYDPQLVDVFCSHAEALLEPIDDRRVLDDVLDS